MKILKGKKIAEAILKNIKNKIKAKAISPLLAVILIGEDEASKIYINLKKEAANKSGIGFKLFKFKKESLEKEILEKIGELNKNKKISGIIVQLPLPKKFNTEKIINSISPFKDVDGFHPQNIKLFLENKARFFPVFPQAILKLVESSGKKLENKKAIVIANSKLFGKMMLAVLERKQIASKYILGKEISDNFEKIKKSDIIVSAVGVPGIVTGEMIKKGAIIVDGGICKREKKVFGDLNFNSAREKAGFITPVPGGVGPVTIACLLQNVYFSSLKNRNR